MIILSILSFIFVILFLVVVIYMGWRMYTFEVKVANAINEMIIQINRINTIEFKVDSSQQDRLDKLEAK
jgi:hypothetical protein